MVVLSFRSRRVDIVVALLMLLLVGSGSGELMVRQRRCFLFDAGGEVDCAAAAWLFFI